jgi:D-glycero-D-manno-heptose 1,7-bisphosphate phosphatase
MPGVVPALRLCADACYRVFVVTNQSGVARGLYDEAAVIRLHDAMRAALARQGAHVDDFIYCPHHPEATVAAYRRQCACRKPAPGMILELMNKWRIAPTGSFLIGDQESDLEAAKAAGISGYLYRDGPLDRFVEPVLRTHLAAPVGRAP